MTPPTTTAGSTGAPVRPRPAPSRPRGGPAAVAGLARVEALRLLRHPAVLAATALYAAFWLYDLVTGDAANRFPVLHDESWSLHLPMLLVAAGVLLAANQGALRAHRNGTESLFEVLTVDRARRTSAHLLAVLPAALLALLLTVVRIAYLAGRPGAAGEIRPWDLAAGPLCVLLAGVVGVLLAVLATSAAVAPMAVVGLGVLTFAGALNTGAGWRWLGLVALEDQNAASLPVVLTDRPAAWHVLWLTALALLLSAAAVLRTGGRGPWVTAVTAVALAGTLTAGVVQTGGVSTEVADRKAEFTTHPAAHQTCEVDGNLTLCAFPDFEAWRSEWRAVGAGVLRETPATVAAAPYAVRQRVFPQGNGSSGVAAPLADWARDDAAAGLTAAVTVGTDWSDGAAAGDRQGDAVAEFATAFAYRVVTGGVPDQPKLSMVCGSRAVLVLALAGRATPGTKEALQSVRDRTFGGLSFPLLGSSSGLSFEPRAAKLAFTLVNRPTGGGAPAIAANWAELSAPGTSVDRAAELLGVPAPAALAEGEQVAGC
ncbi:hypothetical protein ACIRBX_26685 [Kitasatospora sp. NPDC096147]|uniref:hypothetical protein n=1 Tax=Kitasatospora sp. NPDC096147 TaxID=3364093 RepID=UPI00382C32A2